MKWLTYVLLLVAAVLAGLLVFRRVAPEPQFGTALDTPKALSALELVDDRGQPATLSDSHGKLRLMFYGFVRCPDVCPATMNVLARAYGELSPAQQAKVTVQMVSVDPENDRPAVLREYLDKFNPAFVGLTGTTEAVDDAAAEMFVGITRPSVTAAVDHSAHMGGSAAGTEAADAPADGAPASSSMPQAGAAMQAAMLHGDQVSVVDAQGNFVRVYGNQAILSGQLAEDLPALIANYGGE